MRGLVILPGESSRQTTFACDIFFNVMWLKGKQKCEMGPRLRGHRAVNQLMEREKGAP